MVSEQLDGQIKEKEIQPLPDTMHKCYFKMDQRHKHKT